MSLPLFTERRRSRLRRSMSRKAPQLLLLVSPPHRRWKLSILFFISLIAILNLHLYYSSFSVDSSSRVSRTRLPLTFHGPPKIAFLFLVRRDLPLDFLWAAFFDAADVAANFSVFVHSSSPGFELNESTTRSPHFYGRQLNSSIQVKWGESSMLQAEKLLFAAALDDPANQRFLLLSDSCVPLYNFTYIYNYLMASPRSFVDSFLDMKDVRYNPKMSPVIPMSKWRKGSQWITLIRSHAELVVDDDVILAVFKKFCKRRPPVDARKGKLNAILQKQHNCIPDEHYVQTLLAMRGVEDELERRTVTYTEWDQAANKMENTGWHPTTFTYASAGPQKIKTIKEIDHVYYETEYRTEWCRSNSTSVPCFLFGRKFSRGAAMRILSDGVVGRFDPSTLLSTTLLPPS
ncbi:Glycosyltransferase BC10 [Linum perenne]